MSTNFTSSAPKGPVPAAPVIQNVMAGDKYLNITASSAIKLSEGYLAGIFVNSSTSGTLKLWDAATATGNVICNTFTPNLGWNSCPMHFSNALYATVGGTLDCTLAFS